MASLKDGVKPLDSNDLLKVSTAWNREVVFSIACLNGPLVTLQGGGLVTTVPRGSEDSIIQWAEKNIGSPVKSSNELSFTKLVGEYEGMNAVTYLVTHADESLKNWHLDHIVTLAQAQNARPKLSVYKLLVFRYDLPNSVDVYVYYQANLVLVW